jgi:EmrB/QacA subfamily drug resistance transporter
MELLDGTIISTAAPRMARSLGVQSADISVTITAYLLTVAVLIPLSGWLADRIGVRRLFSSAIAIFTIASVLCAISTSLPELTVMRVLQGIGGAMMVPVGRLVVLRDTAKDDVIAVIAFLTWPALVAPVVAPALGGLLTTYASWQWIFLVNVPLGVAAFIGASRLVPALAMAPRVALDWFGLFTVSLALGGLVFGASLLARKSVAPIPTAISVAGGLLTLVVAVRHLLRTPHPLVDLRPLRIRTFRASQTGGSFFRISVLAVPFLLPLMFQDDFGWSPIKAGGMVLFVFVGNLLIKPLTTPLLRRLGFRSVLLGAASMAGVTTIACGLIQQSTLLIATALLLVGGGAFRSIGFSGYNTLAFADIDGRDMTHASTLATTVQQLAGGIGVAFGALALRSGQGLRSPLGHAGSAHLPYQLAFLLLGLLVIPAMVEAWLLPRSAGEQIGGGARAGGTNIR